MDAVLACALKVRGVQVTPMFCDAMQVDECNVMGGVWNGGLSFEENCAYCVKSSDRLWKKSGDLSLRLSKFLSDEDERNVSRIVAGLTQENWSQFQLDDLPLGFWASRIIMNMWTTGSINEVDNATRLGLIHVGNLARLYLSYKKVLDEVQPDRILSNDSFYGMWALLEEMAKRRGIPFFSHWPIAEGSRVAFARNTYAMSRPIAEAWPNFIELPLDDTTDVMLEGWLSRSPGSGGSFFRSGDTERIESAGKVSQANLFANGDRPTALLAANAVWDLAALDKQVVFQDMMDWVLKTVYWFAEHPEFDLIVRPHPVEDDPMLPVTRHRVETVLIKEFGVLPENVRLDNSKSEISDALESIRCVLTHTSTVGMEAAELGIPVITTGDAPYRGLGFTLDAFSVSDYFSTLSRALTQNPPQIDSLLARKFIAFQHFHYYIKHGLFESSWESSPVLLAKRPEDLLPGRNPALDFIIDSIIEDLPVVSSERWPPRT